MVSEVFNCDCMDYMRTIPDKYFDLAIVDPPYGINAPKMEMGGGYSNGAYSSRKRLNGGSGKLKNRILNKSDCTWDETPPDDEYFTELFRISKNQIIWGGNYFKLPPTRCVVVWDKMQPWENFSQVEIAWTSFDSHIGSGSSRIAAYEQGFDFIGCEINETYFIEEEKRFKRYARQGLLDFNE